MSNMRDALGLRVPYGKANSQYITEFDPATRTAWGYFKPKGTACFSLGLLKDIRAHDEALAANGGRVDINGEMCKVNHYVLASRTPKVFNLGGDLALFVLLEKTVAAGNWLGYAAGVALLVWGAWMLALGFQEGRSPTTGPTFIGTSKVSHGVPHPLP